MTCNPTPSFFSYRRMVLGLLLLIALLAYWLSWRSVEAHASAQRRVVEAFRAENDAVTSFNSNIIHNFEHKNFERTLNFNYSESNVFGRDTDSMRASFLRRIADWAARHFGAEYVGDITRVSIHPVNGRPPDDSALKQLSSLHRLEAFSMRGRMKWSTAKRIRDQREHPEWNQIYSNKFITDERLARVNLAGNPGLIYLNISGNAISDRSLAQIARLRRLRVLDLSSTLITSPGLAYLKDLRDLEVLSLGDTDVDDSGMVHLQGLTRLRTLRLRQTRVTAAAIEALKRKLPDLEVQ